MIREGLVLECPQLEVALLDTDDAHFVPEILLRYCLLDKAQARLA